MKKRIFIILAVAVLTIQTAYGMEKDKKERVNTVVVVKREETVIKTEPSPFAQIELKRGPNETIFNAKLTNDPISFVQFSEELKKIYNEEFSKKLNTKKDLPKKNLTNEYCKPKHQYVVVVTEEPMIIEMEKPAWLRKIVLEPKLSKVTIEAYYQPWDVEGAPKEIEKLFKKIQDRKPFTEVIFKLTLAGNFTKKDYRMISKPIFEAANSSCKNLKSFHCYTNDGELMGSTEQK